MKIILWIVGSLLSLVIAFNVGRNFPSHPVEKPIEVEQGCNEDDLKKKLTKLTADDLNAIAGMVDGAEKSKKIEELLGKIVQLFIADLGLHISKLQVSTAPATALPTPTPEVPLPAPTPEVMPPTAPEASARSSKKKFVVQILNAPDEKTAHESLQQMIRASLYDDLKNAVPLSKNQIGLMFGDWEGSLHVNATGKVEKLELSLEQGTSPNKFTFFLLRTGKNGVSRTSGKGDLKDWASLDGEVIIPSNNSYWAITYNSVMDEWFGFYYESTSTTKYDVVGGINLKRRR